MIEIKTFTENNKPSDNQKRDIIAFLFKYLEKYGDPEQDIEKAINYALRDGIKSDGGFVNVMFNGDEIVGAVVINETGMQDYIPENILVYIAMHGKYRGQGLGKKLLKSAIDTSKGNIALHVEPDNPAKKLYEHLGFTNKYLEMRLNKK